MSIKKESEYQKKLGKMFEGADLNYREKGLLHFLTAAPEHYQNEDKMLAFIEENGKAELLEIVKYFECITPPGLAPGDDGKRHGVINCEGKDDKSRKVKRTVYADDVQDVRRGIN